MSKERFEVFGNVIKDNEDIPSLLNNYQATVRLNELNDRIKELEQELAELKEKDNYHLRYELAGADETITNLKKQLEESFTEKDVEGLIEDRNKTIKFLQKELAEKDKELTYMTKQAKKFNNEAQKYYEDAYCNGLQNQKAIAKLEKVKDTLKHFCKIHSDEYYGVKAQVKGIEQDVCENIDNKIKELKGE